MTTSETEGRNTTEMSSAELSAQATSIISIDIESVRIALLEYVDPVCRSCHMVGAAVIQQATGIAFAHDEVKRAELEVQAAARLKRVNQVNGVTCPGYLDKTCQLFPVANEPA